MKYWHYGKRDPWQAIRILENKAFTLKLARVYGLTRAPNQYYFPHVDSKKAYRNKPT